MGIYGLLEPWITEAYHMLQGWKGHLVLKDILQSINLKALLEA